MKQNRILLSILVTTVMLLITGAAIAAEHEQTLNVGRNGEVTFREDTKVGDMTLKAGRYRFQHRVEGSDHFVHFTELTQPYTPGGATGPKAHPGEVKCKIEPLGERVSQTKVYTASEGGVRRLTKVEVRGENVAHIF